MKLFYDTLVPYMPDAVRDESGQLIKDEVKQMGRQCMMDLANFQNNHDVMVLSLSIIHACSYASVDLVDTVIANKDVAIPDKPPTQLLDDAAIMLFKSIKDAEKFDIVDFVAHMLTVIHMFMNSPEK